MSRHLGPRGCAVSADHGFGPWLVAFLVGATGSHAISSAGSDSVPASPDTARPTQASEKAWPVEQRAFENALACGASDTSGDWS